MKLLTGTTVALALSVTAMASVLTGPAMSQTTMMMPGQIMGQIESIDGSTVMVRTADGTVRMYQVDPETLAALKLSNGSTIAIDSGNLMSGVITDVNRYDLKVKLDNGETEKLLVTREDRGTLAAGDRVYIMPDQRLVRAENYMLTAADVRLVQPIAVVPTDTTATTSTVRSSRTEVETEVQTVAPVPAAIAPVQSTTTIEQTTVQAAPRPVRALW